MAPYRSNPRPVKNVFVDRQTPRHLQLVNIRAYLSGTFSLFSIPNDGYAPLHSTRTVPITIDVYSQS